MKKTSASQLLELIRTTREADDFASEISLLISSLFQSEKVSFDEMLKSVSLSLAGKIVKHCQENKLDISDKEQVCSLLENLKQEIKKFKIIKLVLAFDPSSKTIEKIHNFVKDEIGKGYILDIEVNESILAGAIVMHNGKYQNFSLKKTLEETFLNKKEKIIKLM